MTQQDNREKHMSIIRPVDAMEGLAVTGEHAGIAERLREFAGHEAWSELAFVGKCGSRGTAGPIYLSDSCVLEPDDTIKIDGQGTYTPPGPQLNATFEVLTQGHYMCTARLSRPSTFSGACAFKIDQTELAVLPVKVELTNYSFLINLAPGNHSFIIAAHTVTCWFHGLSIFNMPILSP